MPEAVSDELTATQVEVLGCEAIFGLVRFTQCLLKVTFQWREVGIVWYGT